MPPDENDLVKRVIAIGGQTVECRADTGLTVDGKPLNEPYLNPQTMMADPRSTRAWATSSVRSRCPTAGCG